MLGLDLDKSLEGELHRVPHKVVQDLVQALRVGVEVRRDPLINVVLEIDSPNLCPLEES